MNRFNLGYALFTLALAAAVIFSYRHATLPSFLTHQRQDAQQRANINRLNLTMPRDYTSLFAAMNGEQHIAMDDYINYFTLITTAMPQNADAYAVLGFCYAYDGKLTPAAQALQKAITLNPGFFWSYYNLALILWQSGQNPEAQAILAQAIRLPPEQTIQTIASSKIYGDILTRNNNVHYDFLTSLKNAYQRSNTTGAHWQFL